MTANEQGERNYEEVIRAFHWQIPEFFNIGVDVCDKWMNDPGRVALIHKPPDSDPIEYTFADIARLTNQAANFFASIGLRSGDRIAVLLPQSPQTAIVHVAAYKLGAIAVPLFSLFGTEALTYRLADSGARAVVTDIGGASKISSIRSLLTDLEFVLVTDGIAANCIGFEDGLARQSAYFEPHPTKADDPAVIIYTSGTTGPPKGALHAHRVLLGHLPGVEVSHNGAPQPGDRFWTPADWAWIGGLYDVLMPAWHHGVSVVSHRFTKFDPEAAYQLMDEYKIRNAFLPPTALKMMRTVEKPTERWRLNLRSVASGGESLGRELLDWGHKTFGVAINEFYGQTECNMTISSCAGIAEPRAGRIGRPVPGHVVAILDSLGHQLPVDTVGHIAVRRPDPVMFLGYWNNPTATVQKYIGDWLITGDQGECDSQGYVQFVGRDDDLITSAGYRIGPGEVEDCLLGHPAVQLAAVVGMPDDVRTEIVTAFIVLRSEFQESEALVLELQEFVKSKLSAHEYPRKIRFVSELPMTATGKIIRAQLRSGG